MGLWDLVHSRAPPRGAAPGTFRVASLNIGATAGGFAKLGTTTRGTGKNKIEVPNEKVVEGIFGDLDEVTAIEADVICIQEINSVWYKLLKNHLGVNYESTHTGLQCTTVFFNTKRVSFTMENGSAGETSPIFPDATGRQMKKNWRSYTQMSPSEMCM